MNFYFFNSYQQSYVGYQASCIRTGERRLHLMSDGHPVGTVGSCLKNSGARFILYRNKNGDYVMCARGLCVESALDGRKWYINFAVIAHEEEFSQFQQFIYKYYYRHEAFLEELAAWFQPEPEAKLSYSLDVERFERYLSLDFSMPESEFMTMDETYQRGLAWLANQPGKEEIGLLIPEADEEYFRKMNPLFNRMKIQKCFGGQHTGKKDAGKKGAGRKRR